MTVELPPELVTLLSSAEPVVREGAWATLVRNHHAALLHAARSLGGDHDAVMDRYAFVLERLRQDDFRRLRTYSADRRTSFRTWLVVVATRLCLDEYRHRYGRPRATARLRPADQDTWTRRRRLADLAPTPDEPEQIHDTSVDPDLRLRRSELGRVLDEELTALAPADRLFLRLRFEDGLSVPKIAATLGFPSVFHAYRRLGRLLAELQQRLRARGVEDPVA